jgi:hypothetical protein
VDRSTKFPIGSISACPESRIRLNVLYDRVRHEGADASDLSDIESRARFEALLADLTSEFIGVQPAEIDSKIEDALRRRVEFLDVDRAALAELNDAQDELVFTHRWMRTGLPPSYTTVAVGQLFPVAFARIVRGEIHCFGRLDELPDGAPDREALERRTRRARRR